MDILRSIYKVDDEELRRALERLSPETGLWRRLLGKQIRT